MCGVFECTPCGLLGSLFGRVSALLPTSIFLYRLSEGCSIASSGKGKVKVDMSHATKTRRGSGGRGLAVRIQVFLTSAWELMLFFSWESPGQFWYDAGWDTLVSIVTRVWLGHTRTRTILCRSKVCLSKASRRTRVKPDSVHLAPGLRRPGREAFRPHLVPRLRMSAELPPLPHMPS
jgi:hypothetical protein